MRIDILTVVPQLLESPFSASIMQRAQDKGHVEIHVHNIRDYSTNKHKNVDDYQYGGGAGMVLSIEPIAAIVQLSLKQNLLILCGHYKGVDERIRQKYITKEISIGSYVLSGGELAAAVVVDAVVRLIPGVLNDETSALTDSFQDNLLSPPVYTRPPIFDGMAVPDVLLSGDFAKIEAWREDQAMERTKQRRPDLLT